MNLKAMILPPVLAFLSAATHASEWMNCANKTHSIDLLVDPARKQVLGFSLSIHDERQDAISWDILSGTLDPRVQTLSFTARKRSTAPREISLNVVESSGRFTLRGVRGEAVQELSCFWGAPGG